MNERVLQFYSSLSPGFSIPYWLQNEQWAVFGEIESVFKSREDKLKSVCDAMPFLPFLVAVILLGILSSVAGRRGYVSVSTASDAVGWIIAASIVVIGMGRWKKNGNLFSRRKARSKERKKNRNERIEKLVFLFVGALLGAALGTVGTLWVAHLKH